MLLMHYYIINGFVYILSTTRIYNFYKKKTIFYSLLLLLYIFKIKKSCFKLILLTKCLSYKLFKFIYKLIMYLYHSSTEKLNLRLYETYL